MICVRCGLSITGNVDPEKTLVCGLCCLGLSAHVDKHPGEYPQLAPPKKSRVHLSRRRESKEKVCPCGNTFEPDSKGQKYCPLCHDAAHQTPRA